MVSFQKCRSIVWASCVCALALCAPVDAGAAGARQPATTTRPTDAKHFPEDVAPDWAANRSFWDRNLRLIVEFTDRQGHRRAIEEYEPPPAVRGQLPPAANWMGLPDGAALVGRTVFDEQGRQDGPKREFYRSAQVKSVGFFKHGLMDGRFLEYDEQGKVLADYRMVEGTGTREVRYPRGQVALRDPYKDGKKDGIHVEFYETGNPSLVIRYRAGKIAGYDKSYYPNGKIRHFGTTDAQGKLHGVMVYFKATGEVITGPLTGPSYWIHGGGVLPEEYRAAAAKDPTLPPYQANAQAYRKLPRKYPDLIEIKAPTTVPSAPGSSPRVNGANGGRP